MRRLLAGPLLGVAFLLILGGLWLMLNPSTSGDRIAFLNLAVVAVTGIVVAWYTWETRQLRRATLRQTDLQIRPFLTLVFEPMNRSFSLRNIGRGVARDIVMHNVQLTRTAKPGDPAIIVEWAPIDFIPTGDSREPISTGQFVTPEGTQEISKRLRTYMSNFGKHGSAEYQVLVDYSDLTGQRYRAVFEVVRGETFLLRDELIAGQSSEARSA